LPPDRRQEPGLFQQTIYGYDLGTGFGLELSKKRIAAAARM
jgi:hypothetical protein